MSIKNKRMKYFFFSRVRYCCCCYSTKLKPIFIDVKMIWHVEFFETRQHRNTLCPLRDTTQIQNQKLTKTAL